MPDRQDNPPSAKQPAARREESNGHVTAASHLRGRRDSKFSQSLADRWLSMRYWASRTFTFDNIWASVKTFIWVAPLTIGIWIYAEREQSFPQPDVTVPLEFKSTDPSRSVRWLTQEQSITVSLLGPKERVLAVLAVLQRPNDSSVVIELGNQYLPSDKPYQILAASVVGNQDLFKKNGVTVLDPKPSQLTVTVDKITEMDVPVRMPPQTENVESPIFSPSKIHVSGPQRVLNDMLHGGLTMTADLAGRPELRQSGEHELTRVPVKCSIDDPSITFTPTTVDATLKVNQPDVQREFPYATIFFFSPQHLLEKYSVELNPQTIHNIVVTGPAEKVQRIDTLIAQLTLKSEDVDKATQDRNVDIVNLPPGVIVTNESKPNLSVSFKLVPLNANQ